MDFIVIETGMEIKFFKKYPSSPLGGENDLFADWLLSFVFFLSFFFSTRRGSYKKAVYT